MAEKHWNGDGNDNEIRRNTDRHRNRHGELHNNTDDLPVEVVAVVARVDPIRARARTRTSHTTFHTIKELQRAKEQYWLEHQDEDESESESESEKEDEKHKSTESPKLPEEHSASGPTTLKVTETQMQTQTAMVNMNNNNNNNNNNMHGHHHDNHNQCHPESIPTIHHDDINTNTNTNTNTTHVARHSSINTHTNMNNNQSADTTNNVGIPCENDITSENENENVNDMEMEMEMDNFPVDNDVDDNDDGESNEIISIYSSSDDNQQHLIGDNYNNDDENENENDDDHDDDTYYEVERVLDLRYKTTYPRPHKEWKLEWKGRMWAPTWEPDQSLDVLTATEAQLKFVEGYVDTRGMIYDPIHDNQNRSSSNNSYNNNNNHSRRYKQYKVKWKGINEPIWEDCEDLVGPIRLKFQREGPIQIQTQSQSQTHQQVTAQTTATATAVSTANTNASTTNDELPSLTIDDQSENALEPIAASPPFTTIATESPLGRATTENANKRATSIVTPSGTSPTNNPEDTNTTSTSTSTITTVTRTTTMMMHDQNQQNDHHHYQRRRARHGTSQKRKQFLIARPTHTAKRSRSRSRSRSQSRAQSPSQSRSLALQIEVRNRNHSHNHNHNHSRPRQKKRRYAKVFDVVQILEFIPTAGRKPYVVKLKDGTTKDLSFNEMWKSKPSYIAQEAKHLCREMMQDVITYNKDSETYDVAWKDSMEVTAHTKFVFEGNAAMAKRANDLRQRELQRHSILGFRQDPSPFQKYGGRRPTLMGGVPIISMDCGGDQASEEEPDNFLKRLVNGGHILELKVYKGKTHHLKATTTTVTSTSPNTNNQISWSLVVGKTKREQKKGEARFQNNNDKISLKYVEVRDGWDPKTELEKIADFQSLPRYKIPARLELLVSVAEVKFIDSLCPFKHFELIEEDSHMGCGFIPDMFLPELLPDHKNVDSIQVRIYSPHLGIIKGMLTAKRDITKIQIPPSMIKVGKSRHVNRANTLTHTTPWAMMSIKRTHPSKSNDALSKAWKKSKDDDDHINCRTPTERSQRKGSDNFHQISPMYLNVIEGLGVPPNIVNLYEKRTKRSMKDTKHFHAVGVCDPTGLLPEGHIFVSGYILDETTKEECHFTDHRSIHNLIVSRSPCVQPTDMRLLPLVKRQPIGMDRETWDWFLAKPFGTIIFARPNNRDFAVPLPATIADGDLDGDMYFIMFDETILGHMHSIFNHPQMLGAISQIEHQIRRKDINNKEGPPEVNDNSIINGDLDWFKTAQADILQFEKSFAMTKLVGKMYSLGQSAMKDKGKGIWHKDVEVFGQAYKNAMDNYKHDCKIVLPKRLKFEVPFLLHKYVKFFEENGITD